MAAGGADRAGTRASHGRNDSAPLAAPLGRHTARQRVRKRSEFQEIQGKARRVSTPSFVLLVYARDASVARLGVTVSRRVGNAAVRNRAKRVIREAFRATRELWPDDVDLVVIGRRPLEERKLADVVAEWRRVSRELSERIGQARADRQQRKSALAPGG